MAVCDDNTLGLFFVVSLSFSIGDFSFVNIVCIEFYRQGIYYLLCVAVVKITDLKFQQPLLCHNGNRLVVHTANKIAWLAGRARKRHLQNVVRNALFHNTTDIMRHLVKPVRWTQPADSLMRALEVVILHPQLRSILHVLKAFEQSPAEKLLLDRLPEPFDLPLRLRVVWLRSDMFYLHPDHLLLKLRLTSPTCVLPTVISQQLFWNFVFRCGTSQHFQNIVRLLRHIQTQPCDKTGKIIQKPYQINTLLPPSNHADIRLPHQMRALHIRTIILGISSFRRSFCLWLPLYLLWQQ
jgi:hypothetical protein